MLETNVDKRAHTSGIVCPRMLNFAPKSGLLSNRLNSWRCLSRLGSARKSPCW